MDHALYTGRQILLQYLLDEILSSEYLLMHQMQSYCTCLISLLDHVNYAYILRVTIMMCAYMVILGRLGPARI